MARPVVTDFTAEQLASVRAMVRRDNAIAKAKRTPEVRAASLYASYADTASEALLALRTLIHEGGSLLTEAAEIPFALFLTATANAESAWEREGVAMTTAAARRLGLYRQEFRSLVDACRLFPRLA